ncbi:MAG: hypothetical protein IJS10_02240, partial [Alphaproteobacteria bacterium]|nr:hypothetical protein [Alphaproteobacteria bacterium]
EQGKQQAYMSVNASMIETYWHIGERIINIWKSRFPNLTWTHIYRTLRVGDDTAIRWYLGEAYPDATFQTITPDNYQEFV